MLLIVGWLKGLEDQVGNIGQLKIKTVISEDETKDLPTILHHDFHSVKQFEKVFEKLLTII